MIIDIFGSLKENLNKKVRNPFFGTLTIVFVLQNWQLFYSLLFFDSSDNRTVRIDIIESYITQKGGTTKMFLLAVLCSFIVMTISYSLLNASAFISNFFDARVHPWIVSLATKEAKIVTKEKHDLLAERYAKLENQLDDERKKRYEALSRAEEAEIKLNKQIEKERFDGSKTNSEYDLVSKIVHNIKENNEWSKLFQNIVLYVSRDGFFDVEDIESHKEFYDYVLLTGIFHNIGGDRMGFTSLGEKVKIAFAQQLL